MKWRKKDNELFSILRKNYNAKVNRLLNKGIDSPNKLYKSDIRDISRKDFNILKKEINDFLYRNSEKLIKYRGEMIPKYEVQKLKRAVKSVSQRLSNERKLFTFEKGNRQALTSENLYRKASNKDFESWKKSILSKFYDSGLKKEYELYKENYLKSLRTTGLMNTELFKKLSKANPKFIYDKIKVDERYMIDFVYIISDENEESRLNMLWEV